MNTEFVNHSPEAEEVAPFTSGYYRHFKDAVAPITRGNPSGKGTILGGRRSFRSVGRTLRVVYRALYGERKLWVRPASMWSEVVDKPEYHGPRFVAVDEKDVPEESRINQCI